MFGIEDFYHAEIDAQEARRKAAKEENGEEILPLKRKLENSENGSAAHVDKLAKVDNDSCVEQPPSKTAVEA